VAEIFNIGPFPARDIDSISEILVELDIPFEIKIDREEKDAAYFELEKSNREKIGNALEAFGVLFSNEDPEFQTEYVCPVCGKEFRGAGFCPKHQKQLVTFSQYTLIYKEKQAHGQNRVMRWVVLGGAGLSGLGYFMSKFQDLFQ